MTLEGKYHHSHFIAAYNIHRLKAVTETFCLFSFYPQCQTNKKRKLNVRAEPPNCSPQDIGLLLEGSADRGLDSSVVTGSP